METIYHQLKAESEKLKCEKIDKLSFRSRNLINYILFNYDLNILEMKNKDFNMTFEIRNNLILTLANFLE